MFRTLACLTEQHTGWVLPLAALVCWVSSHTALRLAQQARESDEPSRSAWLAAAGFSAGAGVWSTHFIGMLGYDPGVTIGYDPRPTLLSLIVAVVASASALTLLLRMARPAGVAAAGAALGLGVAAMHFSGMAGVLVPGTFAWDDGQMLASIVIGCALSSASFLVFTLGKFRYRNAISATLLTAAIAGLHFTAMGAVEIIPDPASNDVGMTLPRLALACVIAAVMLAILGFAVLALFADHMRRTNRALRASEAAYRLLAESTTDAIIWSDLGTIRRYVSPAIATVLGHAPEDLVGTSPIESVHPDDVAAFQQVLANLTEGRVERTVRTQRYRHKDERWVWIEVSFKITRDPVSGAATGFVSSLRDVTDRKSAEDALRLSERRLAHALDSGSDGLWDLNVETGVAWFSDRWQTMLGYEPGEIVGHVRSWEKLAHPDDLAEAYRLLRDHYEGHTPVYEHEHRMRTKAGAYTWVLARGKVVERGEKGAPLRIVGTHIDIAARKQAEQQIEHLALHDALTGLPNRMLFRERVDHQICTAERRAHSFAVLACDLDRFKSVNDSFGHPAGDDLLRLVAERLTSVIRDGDTVARLGGDEFAVVLNGLDHPQSAGAAAQRLIDAVRLPFDLEGRAASVGLSIGIAVGPQDGGDPDQLFRNADIALYRAKAAGRNTYRFYEPCMDEAVAERNALELEMREAVRCGGFTLHYQPIINVATGAISGFEALMRWPRPSRGAVSPAEFIPLAEETGLIVPLGLWALHEACREAAAWPGDILVAVNVSAVQFAQPGLEHGVVAALAASGLAPNRLELEITESVLMGDAESAIGCLHRLRALGVRIALDDFGTGFSSLSYLRRFPFDKIKIDRSFIHEIADPDTAAIVRAIVDLGERLGVSITAEGVETREQLDRILQEGCTEVQGYLYSKPLPSADALDYVMNRYGRAAA